MVSDRNRGSRASCLFLFGRGVIWLCAAIAALSPVAADAQRVIPSSRQQVQLSYAPLVKRAAPAVVNIYAKSVTQQRVVSPFFDDPFFRRFFGEKGPFRRRPRVQNSLGSGVLVRPDGLVVTNHHVIKKATKITVALADRREFEATVVVADPRTDLAVLRIDTKGERLPFLELRDADDLEVGDLVLAIGNPFGVGQTVTSGIVSALARTAKGVSDFNFFIQTDAAINPGNSGGALITMDGRLVGINSAIFSRGGGSNGIGFAIPANMVATVVDSALRGGEVVRPWFGASVQTVNSDIAQSVGLKRPIGVIVKGVYENGPADRAGLRQGDVITRVNGREVADHTALNFRIGALRVGGSARLAIFRQGRELTLRLPLQRASEDPPRNETRLSGPHPFAGAVVANMSPALAEELSIDQLHRGVIILKIVRRSPAHRVKLRPGDMVVSVNGRRVARVASLRKLLDRSDTRWKIAVRRNGKLLSFLVRS